MIGVLCATLGAAFAGARVGRIQDGVGDQGAGQDGGSADEPAAAAKRDGGGRKGPGGLLGLAGARFYDAKTLLIPHVPPTALRLVSCARGKCLAALWKSTSDSNINGMQDTPQYRMNIVREGSVAGS